MHISQDRNPVGQALWGKRLSVVVEKETLISCYYMIHSSTITSNAHPKDDWSSTSLRKTCYRNRARKISVFANIAKNLFRSGQSIQNKRFTRQRLFAGPFVIGAATGAGLLTWLALTPCPPFAAQVLPQYVWLWNLGRCWQTYMKTGWNPNNQNV